MKEALPFILLILIGCVVVIGSKDTQIEQRTKPDYQPSLNINLQDSIKKDSINGNTGI